MATSKTTPQRPKAKRTAPKRKPRPAAKKVVPRKVKDPRHSPEFGVIPSDNPRQGRTF